MILSVSYQPLDVKPTENLMENNMANFPAFLSKKRQEAGLTQTQLAKAVKLSQPTVLGWEKGEGTPRACKLRNLFRALDLSDEEVLVAIHLLASRSGYRK
tara:strand:+ start:1934 stop:2233 length:300 start_codon:yes stop_codon:yes gene_type:complete